MPGLYAGVGKNQTNHRADVKVVQILLNRAGRASGATPPLLDEDGWFGPRTLSAIKAYESDVLYRSEPAGMIEADGLIIRSLLARFGDPETDAVALWDAARVKSSPSVYREAAKDLGCEAAAIEAVAATETMCDAFDEAGRPTILFERHKFHAFTGGRFAQAHPDLSDPTAGGYGKFSEQYGKLDRARRLDEIAALKSCSWGRFQIMGFNHARAGFADVRSFVAAMKRSEAHHLSAFVSFVRSDAALLEALREKNWPAFARGYNGPGYARNRYDGRMRENYEALVAGGQHAPP